MTIVNLYITYIFDFIFSFDLYYMFIISAARYSSALIMFTVWFIVKSNPVRVVLKALVLIFRAAELMNDIVSCSEMLAHRVLFDLDVSRLLFNIHSRRWDI